MVKQVGQHAKALAGEMPRAQLEALVESLTDQLAAPAYYTLEPAELDQLVEDLEPLAAVLVAAGSQ